MTAYWFYLLKTSICIAVFYLFYLLVLRNSTYFLLNRLYLVGGLLLSFVIPVLHVSIFKSQSNNAFLTMLHPVSIGPDNDFFQPQNQLNHVHSITLFQVLSVIYFIGIAFLFFKLLFSSIRIVSILKNAETYQLGNKKIVSVDSSIPFSFFNLVFMPKGERSPMIVEHELAHVRQLHWIDLVLSEIAFLLLWFNPFVVLYKRALKLQHEYLADSSVINHPSRIETYLGCMLQQIQVVSCSGLTSQFYCKTIKKRIVMITKNKTSFKYVSVYLLVLPLLCMLLFAFTGPGSNTGKVTLVDNVPSLCPVDAKKVKSTTGFGNIINPFTKKKDFHKGIDFAIDEGQDIVSPADGIVAEANFDEKLGNYMLIKHGNEYASYYAHFKKVLVKVGDRVTKGQVIGITGNTGTRSTGPHLHYEVIKNGERVDPKRYLPE